ncbi:MAG: glycosyltransferase family 2 protein [Phycisphaerae bacterium]|nr:glycosyltransferase family 2 protein [Phycisphaerae bacterium]MDD5381676.1 glycosyltransferase family 2 protein [Phycisphaerae bacterium]
MTNVLSGDIQLSVITPIFNEELIIKDSVLKLIQAMQGFTDKWELILVNDGSTDNTQNIITELTQNDGRIKVLTYKNNRGRGYALRTGFKRSCGKYVIAVESDLNYGKEIISSIYRKLLDTDADVVIASPYAKNGKLENVPFKRALLSRLGNRVLRVAFPSNITTATGMTRGYKGDIIRLLPLEEDGKEIHLEIISKACMLGCQFDEIPATLKWTPRQKGKPGRESKFHAGKIIRTHLLFGFYEAPILLFGTLGSLVLLVGVTLGLYLSYLYFIEDQVIGERVILIMTTVFMILAGFSMFLFCFLSYQLRDLRKQIFKLYQKIH